MLILFHWAIVATIYYSTKSVTLFSLAKDYKNSMPNFSQLLFEYTILPITIFLGIGYVIYYILNDEKIYSDISYVEVSTVIIIPMIFGIWLQIFNHKKLITPNNRE